MTKRLFHLLLVVCTSASVARAADEGGDAAVDGWIEGKLQTMTLREKVGQMIMIGFDGKELTRELAAHMKLGTYGSVILFARNIESPEQTQLLLSELQTRAVVDNGIPLLVAVDQEGGQVNRLGGVLNSKMQRHSARTIGRVYDYAPKKAEKLIFGLTGNVARRMKDLGFNLNLAPVLDVTDDDQSFIYSRSYSGDAYKVSRIAGDYVRAMQANGVAATGKHFPNLSRTRPDSHKELPVLKRSREELTAHEFVPFRSLSDHLAAIMVGHVLIPALDPKYPASISPKVVASLRSEIGYRGVLISDDLKMGALTAHYPFYEIVLRSVFAGVDILILAWEKDRQSEAIAVLEHAVQRRKLPMARIDASVRRILALKQRYARSFEPDAPALSAAPSP